MKKKQSQRAGVALVIVLASLVFLVTLALAFLFSSRTELRSSHTHAEGGRAHLLAQSAVNLAMAQISEGTRGVDPSGNPLAWASQPGMIRTYDSSGAPDASYKLYSWDVMTSDGGFDPFAASAAIPGDWSTNRALFVDLNQPISSAGRLKYPIVDGNGLEVVNGGRGYSGSTAIEGFMVKDGAPTAGANANPAPMPVKWLYILADGQIIAPSGGSGDLATFSGAIVPSATNPIRGRIAFWTDDDSSKVNLNTASEGTYWDTPRTSSSQDGQRLAAFQPAQHEFQAYPGHPATTSLSTVFPALTAEQIYEIIPRIKGGPQSSLGGTQRGSAVIQPDADRLYASTGEVLFRQPEPSSFNRVGNNPTYISPEVLERAQFFLTAGSRSPDVNLFNLPRVCLWPIHLQVGPTFRTPFDDLIAFCSTVNGRPYYFRRSSAQSQTIDLPTQPSDNGLERNRKLLNYVSSLTNQPIPGFGGTFQGKYGVKDRDQILTEIFDYVRATNLSDTSVPGLTPFTPLGSGNAITTGSGLVTPIEDTVTNTRGFGRYPTIKGASLVFFGTADDDLPPTNGGGLGTIPPAGQITIRAFFLPQLFNPALGYTFAGHNYYIKVEGLQGFRWQGVDAAGNLVPETNMNFRVDNVAKMTNGGSNGSAGLYGDHGAGGIVGDMQVATGKIWQNLTSTDAYPFITRQVNGPGGSGPNGSIGPGLNVRKNSTFQFRGGDVTITILGPDQVTEIQKVTLNFPDGQFPTPEEAPNTNGVDYRRLIWGSTGRFGAVNSKSEAPWIRGEDTVRSVIPAVGDMRIILPRKVIVPSDGLFTTHSQYFSTTERHAHSLRTSKNAPHFGATGGRLVPVNYKNYQPRYTSATGSPNYIDSAVPADSAVVPATFTNGVALGKNGNAAASGDLPGDWDNGFAHKPDGPYINKPDEGDATFSSTQNAYYGYSSTVINSTLFSPNRMIPSAGMLGSLPSGVWANKPWQTLHFRPGPAGHPGLGTNNGTPTDAPPFTTPPDHLLLDLFHMPVVEPYAISEPLSTAGRINMNYQIVPFTYIERNTGIRAVLKSEKVIAIPDTAANSYKQNEYNGAAVTVRHPVDLEETLEGFERRFDPDRFGLDRAPDIFRSASEICSIHIVPSGATYSGMDNYWDNKRITGDNSRERPYTTVYPRLTTKSNTFTVHYRAQALQKTTATNVAQWDERRDRVTGEFRGFQTIERHIDPNNASLPDFANSGNTDPIGRYYKFRVVQSKQFAQ